MSSDGTTKQHITCFMKGIVLQGMHSEWSLDVELYL